MLYAGITTRHGIRFGRLPTGVVLAIAALAMCGVWATDARAVVTSCSGTGTTFAGGSGTSANPYLVATQSQLAAIGGSAYRLCAYHQTQNIALTGQWTPLADSATPFLGEYDGADYTISGISITSSSSYTGLFSYTGNGAVLKNMRLAGTVNVPSQSGVGALVGLADRTTTITNVHSSVDVTGQSRVGGLVGWLPESIIERSSTSGTVTASGGDVGGLVGLIRSAFGNVTARISDSVSTGSVTGGTGYVGVGGLVGRADIGSAPYGVTIANSFASGAVTGGTGTRQECFGGGGSFGGGGGSCITVTGTTGGLLAPQSSGAYANLTVTASFWDTQTTGRATSADGLATGLTTAAARTLTPYAGAGWDIASGWTAGAVWGICGGTSYPFLTGMYTSATTPCPPPAPAPAPTGEAANGAAPASSPAIPRTPSPAPTTTVRLTAPVDDGATVVVSWSASSATAAVTLTTTLPVGTTFGRSASGCATAAGRIVTIRVPALGAGARDSCVYTITTTRSRLSLEVRGGLRTAATATVRSTATAAAWLGAVVAILERGTPRATLNQVLDARRAGRLSPDEAAVLIRRDVLAVREGQLAAARALDRPPAELLPTRDLLLIALRRSINADRAYVVWLEGDREALGRAIEASIRAQVTKGDLLASLDRHGTRLPAASPLWP